MNSNKLSFGMVGLSGFAAKIQRHFQSFIADPHAHVALQAIYVPDPDRHSQTLAVLREQGVQVCYSYEQLLRSPIQAVWLPVPIQLHRPMTEQALTMGKAVICEKPPAGCVDDVDAMIRARDHARRPVVIAFQDIHDPATAWAKRQLLAGTIGRVQKVTLMACWPRSSRYYGRNGWAGALRRDGVWVLDSPVNNALAHYVNLLLFLLGGTFMESAEIDAVEAELYRVNPIESFDTCSLRVQLREGPSALVLLTHACRSNVDPVLRITGDRGVLEWTCEGFSLKSGTQSLLRPRSTTLYRDMANRFAAEVHATPDERALGTLEIARAQVAVANRAMEAAPIYTLPAAEFTETAHSSDGELLRYIPGIEDVFQKCAGAGRMLHESRLLPWTNPAGRHSGRSYLHFAGPARQLEVTLSNLVQAGSNASLSGGSTHA